MLTVSDSRILNDQKEEKKTLDLKNQKKVSSKTLYETEEGLSIEYMFPIVSKDVYEELQMIAIPDIIQNKIAATEDTIAINHIQDLYFQSMEIIQREKSNASWDMVEVRQVHSISKSTNCLAQQAVDMANKLPCPIIANNI